MPSGVAAVRATIVGGGGAGSASGDYSRVYYDNYNGGCGGEVIPSVQFSVTPGQKVTVVVGAGGSGTKTLNGSNYNGADGGVSKASYGGAVKGTAKGGMGGPVYKGSYPSDTSTATSTYKGGYSGTAALDGYWGRGGSTTLHGTVCGLSDDSSCRYCYNYGGGGSWGDGGSYGSREPKFGGGGYGNGSGAAGMVMLSY